MIKAKFVVLFGLGCSGLPFTEYQPKGLTLLNVGPANANAIVNWIFL